MPSKFVTLSVAALGIWTGSAFAASAQSALPTDAGITPYRAHRIARADRPLTVRHRAAPQVIVAAPVPRSPFAGPGTIITAPVHVASTAVALPFRILGGIFPANGNVATSPFVLVGAPIQAAGEIAQLPFRVVDAAFGAPDRAFRIQ